MDLHHDTELIETGSLESYENNPKKHPEEQIEKLKDSIKEFGFTVPLIITEDNEVICRMMEIDPHYCNVIIDRWEKHTQETAEKIN